MNNGDVVNFIKYTLVGTTGLILDMIILYCLVEFLHMPVVPASAISFFVSMVNNFFLHKYWTFRDLSHHFERQFISFFVIAIANLGITVVCMYFFSDLLKIWYMIAKVITSIIVLIFSYTMNRMWTFKLNTKTK